MPKIVTILLLLACLIAGWAFWPRTAPVDKSPLGTTLPASRTAAAPAVPKGPAPAAPQAAPRKMLRLPDGKEVPPLNGLAEAPPLVWPPQRPYARLLGKEVDPSGMEWYVHADGVKWTTHIIFRSDTGRNEAATVFAEPEAPIPIAPQLPPGTGSMPGPTRQ